MIFNFKAISHFLSGRSLEKTTFKEFLYKDMGEFSVPLVSQDNKGVFLQQHTCFLDHKLMFGLYVRNVMDRAGVKHTGIKKLVKFSIGQAVSNPNSDLINYPRLREKDKYINFEMSAGALSSLSNVLFGTRKSYTHELINGELVEFQNSHGVMKISTSATSLKMNISLDTEAKFELKMMILKYCMLLHPEVPPETTLIQLQSSDIKTGKLSVPDTSTNKKDVSYPALEESIEYVNDINSLKIALLAARGENTQDVSTKTKSCLWAIGHNSWDKGPVGLEIIQAIQNDGGEMLCRELVEKANLMDFNFLNKVYDRINS